MININANIIGRQSGGGGSPILSNFKQYVLADGGTIGDIEWLKARIDHARANGYLDGIKIWLSPSFGYKQANGFVSHLYDVINPGVNTHLNNTGSRRPALIEADNTLNNRPALLGDGDDDKLQTSHSNIIMPMRSNFCLLLLFKPVQNYDSNSRWVIGQVTSSLSPACGIRHTDLADTQYRLTGLYRPQSDINGYSHPINFSAGVWSLLIHRGNTTYINGSSSLTGVGPLMSDTDLLGSVIFGNGSGSPSNMYLAEYMLVQTDFAQSVATSLRSMINEYYNVY
jgi:hypothetical protein